MSAALLAAIAAESAALERFIAILELEQKLLIDGDADALPPLLEQKTGLITELGSSGQQRDEALRTLGLEPRREVLETWFAQASPELQSSWQNLLALAKTANSTNSTNGQLINTRLQHNQQALSVLMNAVGNAGDNTYGPDGHQKHGAGSRTLGSA